MRWGLIAVLISILTACGPELASSAAVTPAGTAPAVAPAPRISPPPVRPPTPPGTNLPAFACADAAGGKTGVANVITARSSERSGYDRFVLQFDAIVPTYTVKRQAKPVFPLGASGQTVTVSGTAGSSSPSIRRPATPPYRLDQPHPQDYRVLKEARQTQDFEGYAPGASASWAPPACACSRSAIRRA